LEKTIDKLEYSIYNVGVSYKTQIQQTLFNDAHNITE